MSNMFNVYDLKESINMYDKKLHLFSGTQHGFILLQ
jgi:hypothetical protein